MTREVRSEPHVVLPAGNTGLSAVTCFTPVCRPLGPRAGLAGAGAEERATGSLGLSPRAPLSLAPAAGGVQALPLLPVCREGGVWPAGNVVCCTLVLGLSGSLLGPGCSGDETPSGICEAFSLFRECVCELPSEELDSAVAGF